MKFRYLIIGICAMGLLTLAACKKDDNGGDQPPQKTVAERIQMKWEFQNIVFHQHDNSGDSSVTLPALSTDYFDIRKDNYIYWIYGSQPQDTLQYELQNDSTMLIKGFGLYSDDGTYKIRNLTDNSLTLYNMESDPDTTTNFAELTVNLKQ